jgi:catechol 2,3-dioxygenase-like lactoylglutathione lyase family enzyme
MTDPHLHPRGVHHLAISTADIKAQIEFFNDVLGLELVALYWMHGVEGAWHGFMKLNDHSSVAFVQIDGMADIPAELGVTHAGNGGGKSAGGTMQHVAFDVETREDLLAMRDRLRDRGVHVMGPLEHGMCTSIYFAGPEQLTLEISTSEAAIDGDHWIDPQVVALAGITDEELARYRSPRPYEPPAEAVPQPSLESTMPKMAYPPKVYQALMTMPDADVTARLSVTDPPVP